MLCTSITNAIPEDIGINDSMEAIQNIIRAELIRIIKSLDIDSVLLLT
jgi:hypothetical protein